MARRWKMEAKVWAADTKVVGGSGSPAEKTKKAYRLPDASKRQTPQAKSARSPIHRSFELDSR